jgi:hypothetical protein
MRKVIDLKMEFWKKDIANIEFDLQSRDEISKLLMGCNSSIAQLCHTREGFQSSKTDRAEEKP